MMMSLYEQLKYQLQSMGHEHQKELSRMIYDEDSKNEPFKITSFYLLANGNKKGKFVGNVLTPNGSFYAFWGRLPTETVSNKKINIKFIKNIPLYDQIDSIRYGLTSYEDMNFYSTFRHKKEFKQIMEISKIRQLYPEFMEKLAKSLVMIKMYDNER